MNIAVVVLLAAVLSVPAVGGMLNGSVTPDQAGVRVLVALLAAMAVEALVRTFLTAVRPQSPDGAGTDGPDAGHLTGEPAHATAGPAEDRRRRRTDT